jgi:hypothetical protein
LAARQNPNDSAVEAFNTVYEFNPIPVRINNQDGTPKTGEMIQYVVACVATCLIGMALLFSFAFVVMIVTALILGAVSSVVGYFRK